MFEEILAALRNPEEGMDFSALADTLESQASTLSQGYQATISQKDASIATLAKESSELKAHNYSLMMKVNTSDKSANKIDPTDDETVIHGVSDLFM